MTTLAKLLARKQQLLERLQENPGQHERDEIERQLEEIDTALNFLDKAGSVKSEQ
jgi:chaperonin cofactor prefoldin